MAKYGEPWRIDSSMCGDYIQTDTGAVASIHQMDRAERAIACANALAGVKNPGAIPEVIGVLTLTAHGSHDPFCPIASGFGDKCICHVGKARAALAKLDEEPKP